MHLNLFETQRVKSKVNDSKKYHLRDGRAWNIRFHRTYSAPRQRGKLVADSAYSFACRGCGTCGCVLRNEIQKEERES